MSILETKNDNTTSEYVKELLNTLDKDNEGNEKDIGEKKYIADNLFEICRMIRKFGIYYVEDLLFVRKISLDNSIIKHIKMYIKMFFNKVLTMMDIYFIEKNISEDEKTTYCNNNFFNKKYYLGQAPVHTMKNYKDFKDYILNDKRSIYELMVSIVLFSDRIDDGTNKIFHYFIRKDNIDRYGFFNSKFITNIKQNIYKIYGLSLKVIPEKENILLLQTDTLLSCLINKRMVLTKSDLSTNCVGVKENINSIESDILYGVNKCDQDFLQNYEKFNINSATGRSKWNINTDNLQSKIMTKYNKLILSGYSNSTLKLLSLINIFAYENINIVELNKYIVLAIIYFLVPKHHSALEIILGASLLTFFNDTGDTYNLFRNFDKHNRLNIDNILQSE